MLERRTIIAGLGAGLGTILLASPGAALAPAGSASAGEIDLLSLEARHGGRLGFAMRDVKSGREIGWRAGERFAYCSTFKLFLAAATLERVDRREERLTRQIEISAGDMIPHAPTTEPAVGATLTIEDLCRGTVELSDNPAANILIREMGGIDAWRGYYASLGDSVTRVDRLEPELNSAIAGDPRDTTTPAQTIANLDRLFATDRLGAAHRALLQSWLIASPTGPRRIRASVPDGWRVGHKTGTGEAGSTNDIGITWTPDGDPILIAAYFTGAADAEADARETVIADAVRTGLKALGRV